MKNERARRVIERTGDVVLRHSGALRVFQRIDARERQTVRILAYHRVNDVDHDPSSADPDIMVHPDLFVEHIKHIADFYNPIGIADLQASLDGTRPLPQRAVLVTFDDGYRDFLTHAWPVLKKHGVPVIVFVATSYPDRDRPFWWDELWRMVLQADLPSISLPWAGQLDLRTLPSRKSAARRLRRIIIRLHPRLVEQRIAEVREALDVAPLRESSVLGWEELRGLAREGVVIAAHTRGHCSMMTLTDEEVIHEIEGSQEDLERELGSVWRAFAFPYGHNDRRTAAALKARGFIAAFSASPGRNPIPGIDRFWLFRQCVGPGHSVSRVQLGLAGFYPVGLVRLRATAWLHARTS